MGRYRQGIWDRPCRVRSCLARLSQRQRYDLDKDGAVRGRVDLRLSHALVLFPVGPVLVSIDLQGLAHVYLGSVSDNRLPVFHLVGGQPRDQGTAWAYRQFPARPFEDTAYFV